MVKIFRVPHDHDILFHRPLSEYELTSLLSNQFAARQRRLQDSVSYRRTKSAGVSDSKSEAGKVSPKPIDADDCCPICQEELEGSSEATTYCRRGCGNHVHARCMEVWAKNSLDSSTRKNEPIKCPLCRCAWQATTLEELRIDLGLQKSGKPPPRLNILCSSCSQPIIHRHFRCLICPSYDSCSICFRRQKHTLQHPMVRRFEGQAANTWEPAPSDPHAAQKARQEIMSALQTRELTVADYDLLLRLDTMSHVKLHDYLLQALPRQVPADSLSSLQSQAEAALNEGGSIHSFLRAPVSTPSPRCCVCLPANSESDSKSSSETLSSQTQSLLNDNDENHSFLSGASFAGRFGFRSAQPSAASSSSTSAANPQARQFRLLPCGHVAHDRCLVGLFVYQTDAKCPLDGQVIVHGLDPSNLALSKRRSAAAKVEQHTFNQDSSHQDSSDPFRLVGQSALPSFSITFHQSASAPQPITNQHGQLRSGSNISLSSSSSSSTSATVFGPLVLGQTAISQTGLVVNAASIPVVATSSSNSTHSSNVISSKRTLATIKKTSRPPPLMQIAEPISLELNATRIRTETLHTRSNPPSIAASFPTSSSGSDPSPSSPPQNDPHSTLSTFHSSSSNLRQHSHRDQNLTSRQSNLPYSGPHLPESSRLDRTGSESPQAISPRDRPLTSCLSTRSLSSPVSIPTFSPSRPSSRAYLNLRSPELKWFADVGVDFDEVEEDGCNNDEGDHTRWREFASGMDDNQKHSEFCQPDESARVLVQGAVIVPAVFTFDPQAPPSVRSRVDASASILPTKSHRMRKPVHSRHVSSSGAQSELVSLHVGRFNEDFDLPTSRLRKPSISAVATTLRCPAAVKSAPPATVLRQPVEPSLAVASQQFQRNAGGASGFGMQSIPSDESNQGMSLPARAARRKSSSRSTSQPQHQHDSTTPDLHVGLADSQPHVKPSGEVQVTLHRGLVRRSRAVTVSEGHDGDSPASDGLHVGLREMQTHTKPSGEVSKTLHRGAVARPRPIRHQDTGHDSQLESLLVGRTETQPESKSNDEVHVTVHRGLVARLRAASATENVSDTHHHDLCVGVNENILLPQSHRYSSSSTTSSASSSTSASTSVRVRKGVANERPSANPLPQDSSQAGTSLTIGQNASAHSRMAGAAKTGQMQRGSVARNRFQA